MPSQAPSSLATTIGQNIRIARAACKLTQRELAARVDVDAMLVSKWERGWHRPNDTNLAAIARETKRELAWFYVERKPAKAAA